MADGEKKHVRYKRKRLGGGWRVEGGGWKRRARRLNEVGD